MQMPVETSRCITGHCQSIALRWNFSAKGDFEEDWTGHLRRLNKRQKRKADLFPQGFHELQSPFYPANDPDRLDRFGDEVEKTRFEGLLLVLTASL